MEAADLITALYRSVGEACVTSPDIAHIEIHGNNVLGVHLVNGLHVDTQETEYGIDARITVDNGIQISHPIRICFGLIPEKGSQHISMDITIEDDAHVAIAASCSFPNAQEIVHSMDADIHVGKNARYAYLEKHVHGAAGGIRVIPKARITLDTGARFQTDFELIKGNAGTIEIEYDAICGAHSILDMSARISGRGTDTISIHEKADLVGEGSRAVLTTNIAVRDSAKARIKNTLIASAPYARGHVECKEIVQGNATASAIPIVEVNHPKAHVTHEAALGSVDSKQLQTLMARGLDEDAATDLIIEGLLTRRR